MALGWCKRENKGKEDLNGMEEMKQEALMLIA
jgi:hypothetical protein